MKITGRPSLYLGQVVPPGSQNTPVAQYRRPWGHSPDPWPGMSRSVGGTSGPRAADRGEGRGRATAASTSAGRIVRSELSVGLPAHGRILYRAVEGDVALGRVGVVTVRGPVAGTEVVTKGDVHGSFQPGPADTATRCPNHRHQWGDCSPAPPHFPCSARAIGCAAAGQTRRLRS